MFYSLSQIRKKNNSHTFMNNFISKNSSSGHTQKTYGPLDRTNFKILTFKKALLFVFTKLLGMSVKKKVPNNFRTIDNKKICREIFISHKYKMNQLWKSKEQILIILIFGTFKKYLCSIKIQGSRLSGTQKQQQEEQDYTLFFYWRIIYWKQNFRFNI